jgi:Na+/H+-dicarboxylate symporter
MIIFPLIFTAIVQRIGIILGVDRVLYMSRTVVNVNGDVVLAAWVDRSEGNTKTQNSFG